MKRICAERNLLALFLLLSVFICSNALIAQTDSLVETRLLISCNKTTSLIFPQIIKSVDRGTEDLLAQKVDGVENILQVKAAKENFIETNMTVITADGKIYSFIVGYAQIPPVLTIQFNSSSYLFEKIAQQKRTVRGVRNNSFDMTLLLKGLYIQNDILYFQLELQNLSNISYDVDLLRFFTRDNKQSKRTASQELDQLPLSVYGNIVSVPGMNKQIIVAALPKFTISDKKKFYIQLMEKNGGRHLRLNIGNRKIVAAKLIS